MKFNFTIDLFLAGMLMITMAMIMLTRHSVNYAKDWLDHSFLFPGLVWSEKRVSLWM